MGRSYSPTSCLLVHCMHVYYGKMSALLSFCASLNGLVLESPPREAFFVFFSSRPPNALSIPGWEENHNPRERARSHPRVSARRVLLHLLVARENELAPRGFGECFIGERMSTSTNCSHDPVDP